MDEIAVEVQVVDNEDIVQVVDIRPHDEGWITTEVHPVDSFQPGLVVLTVGSAPEGGTFVEGIYEATVDAASSRVLFVGPISDTP